MIGRRVVAGVLAPAAVVAIAAGCGGDGGDDEDSAPEVRAIDVGFEQLSITAGDDAVWVVPNPAGRGPGDAVARLDPATGEPIGEPVVVPGTPWAVGVDAGEVWVSHSDFDEGTNGLSQVDPSTGAPIGAPIPLDFAPTRMSFAEGSAWIIDEVADSLVRVDTTNRNVTEIDFPDGADLVDVGVGAGGVWVTNDVFGPVPPLLQQVDRATRQPVRNPVELEGEGTVNGLAVTDDAVWVTRQTDDALVRVDRATGEVGEPIATGAAPWSVVVIDGGVYVANEDADTVTRIDEGTGEPVGTIEVGARPTDLAAGENAIWVANESGTTVSRIALP